MGVSMMMMKRNMVFMVIAVMTMMVMVSLRLPAEGAILMRATRKPGEGRYVVEKAGRHRAEGKEVTNKAEKKEDETEEETEEEEEEEEKGKGKETEVKEKKEETEEEKEEEVKEKKGDEEEEETEEEKEAEVKEKKGDEEEEETEEEKDQEGKEEKEEVKEKKEETDEESEEEEEGKKEEVKEKKEETDEESEEEEAEEKGEEKEKAEETEEEREEEKEEAQQSNRKGATGNLRGRQKFIRNSAGALTADLSESSVVRLRSIEDWNSVLTKAEKAGKPVVIEFFAQWCRSCQRLFPTFADLAGRKQSNFIFVKMSIDDAPDMIDIGRLKSVPTFQIWSGKNGIAKKMNEIVGSNIDGLVKMVTEYRAGDHPSKK